MKCTNSPTNSYTSTHYFLMMIYPSQMTTPLKPIFFCTSLIYSLFSSPILILMRSHPSHWILVSATTTIATISTMIAVASTPFATTLLMIANSWIFPLIYSSSDQPFLLSHHSMPANPSSHSSSISLELNHHYLLLTTITLLLPQN
jgi:hypothetical protein